MKGHLRTVINQLVGRACSENIVYDYFSFDERLIPLLRIGSDEDDEAADEAASADDPYETAVSRDAKKEESISTTNSSASLEHESCCERSAEKEEKEEKEEDTSVLEFTAAEVIYFNWNVCKMIDLFVI